MAKKIQYRVAEVVKNCYNCPFVSEHGMSSKFSNIRCNILNKPLPKVKRIYDDNIFLKNCPLPKWNGKKPNEHLQMSNLKKWLSNDENPY